MISINNITFQKNKWEKESKGDCGISKEVIIIIFVDIFDTCNELRVFEIEQNKTLKKENFQST